MGILESSDLFRKATSSKGFDEFWRDATFYVIPRFCVIFLARLHRNYTSMWPVATEDEPPMQCLRSWRGPTRAVTLRVCGAPDSADVAGAPHAYGGAMTDRHSLICSNWPEPNLHGTRNAAPPLMRRLWSMIAGHHLTKF